MSNTAFSFLDANWWCMMGKGFSKIFSFVRDCSQQVNLSLGLYAIGAVLICSALIEPALAQQGGGIFQTAACNILEDVLKKDFGAMVTALTGILALVAAAAGSFKGAWALIFVSVGSFIFPDMVAMLFPSLAC